MLKPDDINMIQDQHCKTRHRSGASICRIELGISMRLINSLAKRLCGNITLLFVFSSLRTLNQKLEGSTSKREGE